MATFKKFNKDKRPKRKHTISALQTQALLPLHRHGR